MVRPESTFMAATGSLTETSDAAGDAVAVGDPGGFGETQAADHGVLTRPDSPARRAAQPTRDLSPNTAFPHSTRPADSASDSAHQSVLVGTPARPTAGTGGFGAWSMRYTARLMLLDGLGRHARGAQCGRSVPAQRLFRHLEAHCPDCRRRSSLAGRCRDQSRLRAQQDRRRRRRDARRPPGSRSWPSPAVPSRPRSSASPASSRVCVMATPDRRARQPRGPLRQPQAPAPPAAHGTNVRKVIVVGQCVRGGRPQRGPRPGAALRDEVIGVCVPSADVSRAHDAGLPVIGDLDQVPALDQDLRRRRGRRDQRRRHPAQLPAGAVLGPRGSRASNCSSTPD